MIKNRIVQLIKKCFKHSPTSQQELLIHTLAEFYTDPTNDKILLIKGYAGTGKTSVISAMVKTLGELGLKTVLLAPTGRAAKVFSHFSEKAAYTIHKKIYRQKSSKDGFGRFVLDRNLHSNTLFIVDESSMISNYSNGADLFGSGRLLDDLVEFVYSGRNCKLILVGDTAQLPPVGLAVSPALDKQILEQYGWVVEEIELTQVVRQKKTSGILENATLIRRRIGTDEFGFPGIIETFPDVTRISSVQLQAGIESAYDTYGMEETMIITRSNNQANKYNKGIRQSILFKEEILTPGDLLMVVRNNYFWMEENEVTNFIANGDIAELVRVKKYEEIYEHQFADVILRFPDYNNLELEVKIMLDTLDIKTAALSIEENKSFFYSVLEDYKEMKGRKNQFNAVKNNPHLNALQVKYAYAITCHKAQGGQWKAVFMDQGYVTEDKLDKEYYRWLYTGFTRAIEKIYLVNFKDDFFSSP